MMMDYLFIGDISSGVPFDEIIKRNKKSDLFVGLELLKDHVNPDCFLQNPGADIVHAGLFFYSPESLQPLGLASLNWYFLHPPAHATSVSWKATWHAIFFRKGILENLDAHVHYNEHHFSAADLAYQVHRSGGVVKHCPDLLSPGSNMTLRNSINVRRRDLHHFVMRHIGELPAMMIYPVAYWPFVYFAGSRKNGSQKPVLNSVLLKQEPAASVDRYSAIIPTINRYDYLKKAIYSLLNNRLPPAEIIVVDQTPTDDRIADYYNEFDPAVVKVYFLDKAGQSTARNFAVSKTSNDWILFFDDDSVAWEEMITEHVFLVTHSDAAASTGVSLAPWKDRSHIPADYRFYHVSSVLDTGNAFIKKDVFLRVGGLDVAFNRGSGTDDNLGKRLMLNGELIIFNPKAIRTHYKAKTGGLRTHGAWWRNRGRLMGEFPLATESYNLLKFYPRTYYWPLCFRILVLSFRTTSRKTIFFNTVLFPFKVLSSLKKARKLLKINK